MEKDELYNQMMVIIEQLKIIVLSGQYPKAVSELLRQYSIGQQILESGEDIRNIHIQGGCRMYIDAGCDYMNPILDNMYKAEKLLDEMIKEMGRNPHERKAFEEIVTNKSEIKVLDTLRFGNREVQLQFHKRYEPNNVKCFDLDGDELWEINDILKEEKPAPIIAISKRNESEMIAFTDTSVRYLVDVEKEQLLGKEILRGYEGNH